MLMDGPSSPVQARAEGDTVSSYGESRNLRGPRDGTCAFQGDGTYPTEKGGFFPASKGPWDGIC